MPTQKSTTSKKKPPPDEAAAWVKGVRRDAKMTQEEFGKEIGVHWVTVSNWERGKYAPDWESAERIRKHFPGAPPAPGVVPPAVADRLDSRPKTLEAAEVAALMDTMRPELRAYVRDTIYRILSTQHENIPPTEGLPRLIR